MKLKLVLMGTNDWVVPMFDRVADEHDIIAVFTRAPKPAGRKMELQKSPVHIWAENRGLPIYTNINEYNFKPDFNVVASYGVILRDNVLDVAPTINLHPSKLPMYRGPSPMRTALLNGDRDTAVCLMDVGPVVDAGDVHMCRDIDIDINYTNDDLERVVSEISADMLSEYLNDPSKYPGMAQVGEISHTRKYNADDTIIDWNKSPLQIHNQVRAIGGRTKINGADVKILSTRMNGDEMEIVTVQPAGKRPMDWRSFVNGQRGEIHFGKI